MTGFRIEALRSSHDRSSFSCGVEPLDRYLRQQAGQDMRRRAASCFVAIDEASDHLAGYYTLAATGIPLIDLPETLAKKLPRYPSVPAALIGRLAVDLAFRGRELGKALLWDAMIRAARSDVGVFAAVVDAKDETAASFYRHFGFMPFENRPLHLFMPLAALGDRTLQAPIDDGISAAKTP